LGLKGAEGVKLEATSLYEASATLRRPGQAPQRWHVSHDGRCWSE
jgi:hypothetical protein